MNVPRRLHRKESYRLVFIKKMIEAKKNVSEIKIAWNKMKKESLNYIDYVVFNTNMFR
jgi:hypothetical protein